MLTQQLRELEQDGIVHGRSHITAYTWWLPKLLISMTFILNKRKQEFF
ncbi:winged helix-turn-helix transcriptional regulator [Enterococcus faecium]|nr:winged helix-turn-helix transcriptional regulator [Enterococcus faecium]